MNATDPAKFDPEATGAMRIPLMQQVQPVKPLADALAEKDTPAPPYSQPLVSLTYADSLGNVVRVDRENPLTHWDGQSDTVHRERLILRALLTHTLAMLDGDDVT